MSPTTYAGLVDLAAASLLLASVLVVWRRDVRAMVTVLAVQGLAVAALPVLEGLHGHEPSLFGIAGLMLALRAVAIPAILAHLVRDRPEARETRPLVNVSASLLVVALLTTVAYGVAQPLVALDPTPAVHAAPAALAVVLIAVFTMATRRRAMSQVIGFLMLDNGIVALAFLTTQGIPLVVELGASLDVLLAVVVLQVLVGRMRAATGGADLDDLAELRD
ncbi:MAG: hypothetical protein ACYCXA_12705 [Actinomycetes bacterium]